MVLRFADFELDVEARALRRAGAPLPLEPRAFDLLVHLARNAERVIRHDELLRVVWPGVRVTRASVDQAVRSVRRALGDSAREPRFVRTVARRGLQFASVLEPGPALRRRGAFVGRVGPLGRLRECLDAVQRGVGSVVLITGSAGIGKTRTASEALAWAAQRGLTTATVSGSQASASAAGPWRALVAGLGVDAQAIERAAERGALFPELRDILDESCARSPLVVLLDDVHDADAATIGLLEYLSGHPRRPALLAIATARPAPEFASADAACAFDRLRSRAGALLLELEPFSSDEVAQLIEVETGTRPSLSHAAELAERMAGNPLWIHQLLRAGAWLEANADAEWERFVARGMREVLRERLAVLCEEDRQALRAAALLGDPIDASLVGRVCDIGAERARRALAAARAAGVVSGALGAGETARFAHPFFRDALLEGIDAERVAALHLAAARVLEALPRALGAEHDAQIASHFLAAGRRGDPARAVALGLEAGRRALRERAGDRAEPLLVQTTELLDAAGASAEVRSAAWLALAIARSRGGVAEISGAAEQALAWARRADQPAAFAEAALAWVGAMDRLRLPNPRYVDALEEALARLGSEHPALSARVLGRLEAELSYAPEIQQRTDLRERALGEARRSGDAGVEVELLALPFGGFWEGLPAGDRWESIERCLAYATTAERRDLALTARLLRSAELAARGELARQGDELELAAREARELGDLSAQYRATLHSAVRAHALGELERSDELAVRAQGFADRNGFPGETIGRAQRLMVVIARGRARDALAALELARRVDAGPGVAALLAHALAAAGERARCAELLRELQRDSLASLPRYPSRLANAHVLARAADFAGVAEVVSLLEPILAPERGRVAVRGLMASHGPVSLALASCARLRGALAEAAVFAGEAEQLAVRAGAPGWLAEAAALREQLSRATG